MMRIITGRARGAKLTAPKGETTRPTAERTKEAIFSSLQFDIQGREVLDLFAGSGQMALEALSRGAKHAVL
jgi:16S rRNA (guanine(966)-N(2))-methyltransferase RsmD